MDSELNPAGLVPVEAGSTTTLNPQAPYLHMIALSTHEHGTVLPVKARPGARNNGVTGEHDGLLKVSVTQVAEKGKANRALIGVLAAELGLRKSQIELIGGETSSTKQFLIHEITPETLAARLEELLGV